MALQEAGLTGDNGQEEAAMTLHPKMRVFDDIKVDAVELEVETSLSKLRWNKKKTTGVSMNLSQGYTDSNLPHVCSSSGTISQITSENSVDFSTMRIASLPCNKDVHLPDMLDSKEEVKLAAYKTEVLELVRKYALENCTQDGKQVSNLTPNEIKGLKSIKNRCKSEDLDVMETDKSEMLSLMTRKNFASVTETHVLEDTVINSEELQSIERTLNAHCCQVARAFCLCSEQGDFRRVKRAITNSALVPPPLRSLRKDHKKVPEELQSFGPPSRPVGDGNNAPDTQLSWMLATIWRLK